VKPLLIRLQNVSTNSLKNFSLWLGAGEMVGMVIINEYGIESLVSVLEGREKPTSGQVMSEGVAVIDGNSRLAMNMTIAENLFVLRRDFKGRVKSHSLEIEAQSVLESHQIEASPRLKASALTMYERMRIEILKAKVSGVKVVIFNNIGKLICATELYNLRVFIKSLQRVGMAFIYMDSYPDLILNKCNRHYLYNSGQIEKTFFKNELSQNTLEPYLELQRHYYSQKSFISPLVTFTYSDVSYQLFRGECLTVWDKEKKSLLQFMKRINQFLPTYLIPENPVATALYLNQSYLFNLTFGLEQKIGKNIIPKKFFHSIQREFVEEIGPNYYLSKILYLNKEELLNLVYYRVLLLRPEVVVIYQPFVGIDMQKQNQLLSLINRLKRINLAVVILSSHLGNLERISDQIVKM